MKVIIDSDAGFCFGVQKAINRAEEFLDSEKTLYCLGEIVHNNQEVNRLHQRGLVTIDRDTFNNLKDETVLLRAHGEPAETYETAKKNNLTLIDATCPLVIRLQKKIKSTADADESKLQIIVYGKPEHPEIIGLKSQAPEKVVVVNSFSDLDDVDFQKPVKLFSQTTKDKTKLLELKEEIEKRIKAVSGPGLEFNDTICKQVHNRNASLREFCKRHDVIIFAGGKKSSNARVLFDICKKANSKSYFVSGQNELDLLWYGNAKSVGISGATSTPWWLLEEIKTKITASL